MSHDGPPTEFIDKVCDDIAIRAIGWASSLRDGMPGNSGQESIVADWDIDGAYDSIFAGEVGGWYIDPSHPEAVGMIADAVNEVIIGAQEEAKLARETITWADVV